MGAPLILLEFDDVIVVAHEARREALRQAAAADAVTFTDVLFDAQCAGVPFRLSARTVYASTPFQGDETAIELAAFRAARHFKAALARGALLAPGIAEHLRLRSANSRFGLVAASPADDVMPLLELAGLADAFSTIVCDDERDESHSLAALWTRARARLSRSAAGSNEVVAIVASAAALEAARKAGCRTAVGVPVALAL